MVVLDICLRNITCWNGLSSSFDKQKGKSWKNLTRCKSSSSDKFHLKACIEIVMPDLISDLFQRNLSFPLPPKHTDAKMRNVSLN